MAIGVVGPIGADALHEFAVSRALRLLKKTNAGTANCKVCGTSCPKGTGLAVTIAGVVTGSFDHAFVCAACAERIADCAKRFPLAKR